MIRATTGGVLRTYRANLMNSFIRDNNARNTVLTQRVFNSYAEDPAAAAKAFRLRKARLMASSQLTVCDNTYHKYQVAYSALQTVDQLIDTENGGDAVSTLKDTTLRMLNDPTGDARTQLNKVLDNLSDTIIQMMNQTYGNEFVFAGADGYNVPFTVREEDGVKRLYYRGVPVDASVPNVWQATEDDGSVTLFEVAADGTYPGSGYYLKMDNVTEMDRTQYEAFIKKYPDEESRPKIMALDEDGNVVNDPDDPDAVQYLVFAGSPQTISTEDYEQEKLNAEKLEYMANEKRFVDIGLGFKEDSYGAFIESSGFNECLSGLNFLGYGLDGDGDPKNIYSIVQRLTEISGSVSDEDWGSIADEFDRLVGKLEDASSEFKTQFTNHSAGTEKLKNSYDMLEENIYNLKEQYSDLEDVDMADAISSFLWAEYCYNAALKVGNSILSQSLMDYLS